MITNPINPNHAEVFSTSVTMSGLLKPLFLRSEFIAWAQSLSQEYGFLLLAAARLPGHYQLRPLRDRARGVDNILVFRRKSRKKNHRLDVF